MRRLVLVFAGIVTWHMALAGPSGCEVWPAWQRYQDLYLSADGRVIDAGEAHGISTSEGQAYALFFALAANDSARFARILQWTQDNLAHGDLARQLPAWKWGRANTGAWTVLDSNSASDADLWIAYTLMSAGRLWRRPDLRALGERIAGRILSEETMYVPGLGASLLPGAHGFYARDLWRLNPSYAPLQLLRGLRRSTGEALWEGILETSAKLIDASAPHGFASDWIEYRADTGFAADVATHGVGSYDAIRVYLWAGMLPHGDPFKAKFERLFAPMLRATATRHAPPETVDVRSLDLRGEGSPGFSAALLPLLAEAGPPAAAQAQLQRARSQALRRGQSYFSDALSLFGLGWYEHRFGFDRDGQLTVAWKSACGAH
jgi:endoglucanase